MTKPAASLRDKNDQHADAICILILTLYACCAFLALIFVGILVAAVYASVVVTKADTRTYVQELRLVKVNPPKHFAVHLEDPHSGARYYYSVGKHCSQWRTKAIVGTLYTLEVQMHFNPSQSRYVYTFPTASRTFC